VGRTVQAVWQNLALVRLDQQDALLALADSVKLRCCRKSMVLKSRE
jgi:hypothetical protein